MGPMRTPDDDGSGEGAVSSTVGDGFGPVTGDDLEDGFGDDDFSDDNTFDDSFGDDTGDSVDTGDGGGPFDDTSDTSGSGDTPFGDGLSDDEAENVLVEILEDVFGADAPDVLDTEEAGTSGDGSDVFGALAGSSSDDDGGGSLGDAFGDDGVSPVVDDPFDPFEPAEIPSDSDLDFTGDGRVDVHDLHEAAHPFDFDITE